MLLLDLPTSKSARPQPTEKAIFPINPQNQEKEYSVVVGSHSSSTVEMFSWQTMPAAVSMSGEKTQDMMNITSFFQPVRHLLSVGHDFDSVAIFFSKTIRIV